jgi:poly-gamma-glutamate capsule biosynthesis protein CapA/YwtB (metallophosphatase superfamily)
MIQLIGDLALTGLYVDDPSNNASRLKKIRPLFENDALKFANLETPIFVENSQNPNKNKIHTTNKQVLQEVLLALKIDVVSLANNHIYDCKMPGLKATIEALDEIGIKHTGAGWKQDHVDPIYLEENDKKIAFVAYVDKNTNPKAEKFEDGLFINYLDQKKIIADISNIKAKVDIVICSLHWGKDYSFYPTKKQIEIAHTLVDAGATIIMGHHPHTIQPFERYKESTIFYSLGSLTFGDHYKDGKLKAIRRKTKKGIIVEYDLGYNNFNFTGTKEYQGNYIKKTSFDYEAWSKLYWKKYLKRKKFSLYNKWVVYQEKIFDRVYEYFFGYYQNPIKRLFQIKNIKKIKRLTKN